MKHLGILLAALPEKEVEGDTNLIIEKIAYDSRRVCQGDLFVAIEGFQTDGHRFVEEAISRGAVAVVFQENLPAPGVVKVKVPNSRRALAILADEFYNRPSEHLKVIGITGTNGKTTISYLSKSILDAAGWKTGLIGTIGYRVGDEVRVAPVTTPESLDLQYLLREMLWKDADYAVMEVSSHALSLDRVYGVRFEVGVFSNLSRDHLDFHLTLEDYFQAKATLFRWLAGGQAQAVINRDDPAGRRLMELTKVPIITYGFHREAHVYPLSYNLFPEGTRLEVVSPIGRLDFFLRLPGRFNIYNALAAIGVGIALGISPPHMVLGLEAVERIRGRFEKVECGQDFTVLIDYSHTPDALENCLQAARGLTRSRVIVVFGCGGDRDPGKRPLMGEVAAHLADYTILTSDNPRSEDPKKIIEQIEAGIPAGSPYEKRVDRTQAIHRALHLAQQGDVVVIAGKGHEDYQIIGDRRIHFDDREVAEQILRSMVPENGGPSEVISCSSFASPLWKDWCF